MTREELRNLKPGEKVWSRWRNQEMVVSRVTRVGVHLTDWWGRTFLHKFRTPNLISRRVA
jgi:hypothetical protein